MPEPISIQASMTATGVPLQHFWSTVVGAGRAMGVRPFVGFGFCPRPLARETDTVFWWGAHGAPPTDLGRWSELVRRTVAHWVDRYGPAEVLRWYFEVWNEANLRGFFRGTRSEYFELYSVTVLAVKAVKAVKAVDGELRVGGPATSNFVPDTRSDGETEDFTAHHYPAEVTHSVPASFDDRTVAERTETTGEPRSLELVLDGLRPGAVMAAECLGTEHGNAVAAWRRLGSPRETTREQERLVDRLARATSLETFVADADGVARLTTMLAPWSVVLVRQTHQQGEWA